MLPRPTQTMKIYSNTKETLVKCLPQGKVEKKKQNFTDLTF